MSFRLHRDHPKTLASAIRSTGLRSSAPGTVARHTPRWPWLAAAGLCVLALSAWQYGDDGKVTVAVPGVKAARAAAKPFHADCSAEPAALQDELSRIAQQFDGKVGIGVTKVGCGWVAGARLDEFFPQQSVSKLWVSLTVLDAIDAGRMKLDQPVTIRPIDLTLFNQPLQWAVLEKGAITLPVETLMRNALSFSDNTANDRLLWTVGGPDKVRATLRDKGIEGIRFGPGERLLQSKVAGLTWSQDLSVGHTFEQTRSRLPDAVRQAALQSYIADPMDGATPKGMVSALAGIASGQLLSPSGTAVMMGILAKTHSGPRRLKGGVPAGWKIYHKTGTGQEFGRLATGYNDVGLLEAPDGSLYALAAMIKETRQPIPVRMDMMQSVTRAVAQFHEGASKS